MILKYDVPPWFLVTTSSIISFYFGHVNGTAEKNTTQAGDIAITALRQAVNTSPDQPNNTTKVITTTSNDSPSHQSSSTTITPNKGIV